MAKISKVEAEKILYGGKSKKDEPVLDINNYSHTMAKVLSHYNFHWSSADYKKYAVEYAFTLDIKFSGNTPEHMFRGVGAVGYLILHGAPVKQQDIDNTIAKLKQIQIDYDKIKISKVEEPVLSNVIPIKQLDFHLIDYLNSIEDDLIDSILNKKDYNVEIYISNFTKKEFKSSQAKEVVISMTNMINTFQLDYNDLKAGNEDLKEGWSHIPSTRIKTAINALKTILNGINTILVKDKVIKVKLKKELTPLQQTINMPYLKEYENIHGIHPEKCVGCSEIWVYDTETRDINVIRSIKDTKLSAKGFTFQNVDEVKSFRKKLRKPEDLLLFTNSLETINKKFMLQVFDSIKTKAQATSGRLNTTKIIINTFK